MAYFFRLPTIIELTIPQQTALNDPGPIAVSGGPGTGKSVVSLWRHIRNWSIGKKTSLLLTYTVTLTKYLSSAAANENEKAGAYVQKTYWWLEHEQADFDEIIIDEAQDVNPAKNEQIGTHSHIISYGADDQQIIWPELATTQEELEGLFPNNTPHELDENFRNSLEIMEFTRATLPKKFIPQDTFDMLAADNRRGNKPIILLSGNSAEKQNKAIIDVIKQFNAPDHNIAVLTPFKSAVVRFYELIRDAQITCSKYTKDDEVLQELENVHVTTFKSCKGTEFDTVIIPDFHNMAYFIRTKDIVEENDYYVAFTRTRRNLFLISATEPATIKKSTYQIEQIK